MSYGQAETSAYYRCRLPKLRQRGGQWRGPCPIHNGTRDSFSVNAATGQWMCHSECDRGGSIVDFEMELSGKEFKAAAAAVDEIVGRATAKPVIVAEYDYRDAKGSLLYQVVRMLPKDFRQRRPDGRGGWIWDLKGVDRVLYRLSEVLEAPIVFFVEGEKDVESLRLQGFVATTACGGAKARWEPQYTEALRGREVILIPDNDGPGLKRAEVVGNALLGAVSRLRLYRLPADCKDVSEFFEHGHSEVELISTLEGVANV